MPIRKIRNSGKSITGYFPSIKMKRMIAFESSIERDYIYLLDFEQDVLYFEEQPLTIEYHCGAKARHYTPDFLITQKHSLLLVECKPQALTHTEENQRKFDAARSWCDTHGYLFRVVTEEEIRQGFLLDNIKTLTKFARQRVAPDIKGGIYSVLYSHHDGLTLDCLANRVAPTDPSSAIPCILSMAFHHEIVLKLDDEVLSGYTLVKSY